MFNETYQQPLSCFDGNPRKVFLVRLCAWLAFLVKTFHTPAMLPSARFAATMSLAENAPKALPGHFVENLCLINTAKHIDTT